MIASVVVVGLRSFGMFHGVAVSVLQGVSVRMIPRWYALQMRIVLTALQISPSVQRLQIL
jgi:hypothetical protein